MPKAIVLTIITYNDEEKQSGENSLKLDNCLGFNFLVYNLKLQLQRTLR